jgi:hypothetical protein
MILTAWWSPGQQVARLARQDNGLIIMDGLLIIYLARATAAQPTGAYRGVFEMLMIAGSEAGLTFLCRTRRPTDDDKTRSRARTNGCRTGLQVR